MPVIGLVDDRPELRETARNLIANELPESWQCTDIDPLAEIDDYRSWIVDNGIAVIVLDEKLHEQAAQINRPVDYEGHEVVDLVRSWYPTLPVFVVTSFPDDGEIRAKFKDVEGILHRREFARDSEGYVSRMIRAGQKYTETYENELNELSERVAKVASGNATDEDLRRINVIREKMQLAFATDTFIENTKAVKNLESYLDEMEKVKEDVENLLRRGDV